MTWQTYNTGLNFSAEFYYHVLRPEDYYSGVKNGSIPLNPLAKSNFVAEIVLEKVSEALAEQQSSSLTTGIEAT